MGVFTLIPRAGAKYSAEVTGPDGTVRRFDLPAASDSAAVLSVDNRTSACMSQPQAGCLQVRDCLS